MAIFFLPQQWQVRRVGHSCTRMTWLKIWHDQQLGAKFVSRSEHSIERESFFRFSTEKHQCTSLHLAARVLGLQLSFRACHLTRILIATGFIWSHEVMLCSHVNDLGFNSKLGLQAHGCAELPKTIKDGDFWIII